MVFESVVVEVLNRFLGDFVENLDKKQLNIGIWGGDIALHNLQLKASILQDADLPVQLYFGKLGKLVLKIPWKNLYTQPVIADIEDLFVVLVPNTTFEYNAEKEKVAQRSLKRSAVKALEDARQRELDKDKPKPDKGFVEKLIAQIINNVQVNVKNIHIRFEDKSDPENEFAFGITLHEFAINSTDANWIPGFSREIQHHFHKIAALNSFAAYMNVNTDLFINKEVSELPSFFERTIATQQRQPADFRYVLGPISAMAKLKLNLEPEYDDVPFTVPKASVMLHMPILSVGISRFQYRRLITLVDDLGFQQKGIPYRKYRPFNTPYNKNAKIWWQFAFTCVLETQVRVKRREWDFNYIKEHCNLRREYSRLYLEKLRNPKKIKAIILEEFEDKLDIENITLARLRAERIFDFELKEKLANPAPSSWFSSWFTSKDSSTDDKNADGTQKIMSQVKKELSEEEKRKLCAAIGYVEGKPPTNLPEDYEAINAEFILERLEFKIRIEETDDVGARGDKEEVQPYVLTDVITLSLTRLKVNFTQRPTAEAIRADVTIDELKTTGYEVNNVLPNMILTSYDDGESNLLKLSFETNPLDKTCEQRLRLNAQSLNVFYDAETIIQLLTVLKAPKSSVIEELQGDVKRQLDDMKERSATGMQYVLSQHPRVDININLKPIILIVPYGGCYKENDVAMIVVSLGNVSVVCHPREPAVNIREQLALGIESETIMDNIIAQAYDVFDLTINNVQIAYLKKGEKFNEVLMSKKRVPMNILEPTLLTLRAELCIIDKDPRLPKMRIAAKIPQIEFGLTEDRMLDALGLALSIPLPESEPPPPLPLSEIGKKRSSFMVSTLSLSKQLDEINKQALKKQKSVQNADIPEDELIQCTNMEVAFILEKINIVIYKSTDLTPASPSKSNQSAKEKADNITGGDKSRQKLIQLQIRHLQLNMLQHTFDLAVMLRLGAISMSQFYVFDKQSIKELILINTPSFKADSGHLIDLNVLIANKESPEFTTKYRSIEQYIEFNFAVFVLHLYQHGLEQLIQIAFDFQQKIDSIAKSKSDYTLELGTGTSDFALKSPGSGLETIAEDEELEIVQKPKDRRASVIDSIKIKLVARMEQVAIVLENEIRPITEMKIAHVNLGVILKSAYTELAFNLQDIQIMDKNPVTVHEDILSVLGGNAICAKVVLYNVEETKDYNSDDMKLEVSMGCVKLIFVNWFVNSVLGFLDHFQAAQDTIKNVADKAAKKTADNAVEVYEKATRINMNIRIKAPVIFIPVEAESYEALCIDLGYLIISNSVKEYPGANVEKGPGIVDYMKIELYDMKIGKVDMCALENERNLSLTELDTTDGAKRFFGICKDKSLLKPTSFTLHVDRNLTASWFKQFPAVDVSGKIHKIEFNFIRTDFQTILAILAKNLSQGTDERLLQPNVVPKVSQKSRQSVVETVASVEPTPQTPLSIESGVAEVGIESNNETQPDDPFLFDLNDDVRLAASSNFIEAKKLNANEAMSTFKRSAKVESMADVALRFNFQLESIVVNLFTTHEEGLATIGVYTLSAKGTKLVDESMNVNLILNDFVLEDIRPGRENYITRFVKKRGEEEDESSGTGQSLTMIDLVARIKPDDIFANLRVTGLDVILSLEFLLKIADYMQLDEPVEPKSEPVLPAPKESKPTVRFNETSSKLSAPVSKKTLTTVSQKTIASTQKPTPNKKMNILVHIEEPYVILVEKMDDPNCYTMIFRAEVGLRFRQIGARQAFRGEINDVQLYICELAGIHRLNASKYYIIRPFTLTVHGAQPGETGLHIDIEGTEIRINISPGAIELVNVVINNVLGSRAQATDNTLAKKDYSNIWGVKPYDPNEFWFLKVEEGVEVITDDGLSSNNSDLIKNDIVLINFPAVILTIESGFGYYTQPMLIMEAKMKAQIKDWSADLDIDSSLNLSLAYWNSAMATWEALIEPIEKFTATGESVLKPWEVNLKMVVQKDKEDPTQAPTTLINVSTENNLELTITKSSLDVFSDLGNAFQEAVTRSTISTPESAPYIFINDTGFEVTLDLRVGHLRLHPLHLPRADSDNGGRVVLFQSESADQLEPEHVVSCKVPADGKVFLDLKVSEPTEMEAFSSVLNRKGTKKEKVIYVTIGGIEKQLELPVHKADRRYFPLYRDTQKEPWGIISDVKMEFGAQVIVLHSVVKIKNHFSVPMHLYRERNKDLVNIMSIGAGETINVPLHAVYAVNKEFFFAIDGYKPSKTGFMWKESLNNFHLFKRLQCEPENSNDVFFITLLRTRSEVYNELTNKHTMMSVCYTIHLKPPLSLRNTLPIDIHLSVSGCTVKRDKDTVEAIESHEAINSGNLLDYGERIVKPGDIVHLPTIRLASDGSGDGDDKSYIVVRLVQYLEKDWSCTTEIPAKPPQFAVWTFNSYDSVEVMSLELGVQFEDDNEGIELTLYCPYWMINKTGLNLAYRRNEENVNVLYHPANYDGPILLSYREKAFFSKKKASIRVDSGDWSEQFSLDLAGSSGCVTCKTKELNYEIIVSNRLTSTSLTKQITLTPKYILMNKTTMQLMVQEDKRPGDPWFQVPKDTSVPFWPKADTRLMKLKLENEKNTSRPFRYNDPGSVLLRMKNEYGGVNIETQVTEGGTFVTFIDYNPGDAPVMIINNTDDSISFFEKGDVNERVIPVGHKQLYTWTDPAGPQALIWKGDDNKIIECDMRRDDIGNIATGSRTVYWVSLLDGTQRVLLFTSFAEIAQEATSADKLAKNLTQVYSIQDFAILRTRPELNKNLFFNKAEVTQIITVEIHGLGLSLVNNTKPVDIMYFSIANSGIKWQEKSKKRFKDLKQDDNDAIETQYQKYLNELEAKSHLIDSGYQFDKEYYANFDQMVINKESRGDDKAIEIRRSFFPGIWMCMRTSMYQMQLHLKINHMQIDNQLKDHIFPVVFAAVPPPKSVVSDPKPFIECSIVQRIIPHSNVRQINYLSVLIQELHFKLDLLFINEIAELVATEVSEGELRKKFELDMTELTTPLSNLILTRSAAELRNYYDMLHLSPLKIHISFSMAGLDSSQLPVVLSTVLSSVGVTLTDINDIVFRLAYFERQFTFLTQRQLVSEIISHYTGQAVKQAYVLIFGLDVIGNPFGLVVGIKEGVEALFYEPYKGAIQGPGEFAAGLVLGVRQLFGHTVGGAAGAVSKITGAMGKGLAALTFDDDYQKKRRQDLNKKPTNLSEGLARGGKGLVMGVVGGVTGVISKPLEGAQQDGVGGFFKGVGKGAIGLVTRPTAGVVDFASGTLGAVKRCVEVDGEVTRIRPPRVFYPDGIMRPFNANEAEGNKIFHDLERGKFVDTDQYAHMEKIIQRRSVILLTNQRLIHCERSDLLGHWKIIYQHLWNEIAMILPNDDGIDLLLEKKKAKTFGILGSSKQERKNIPIAEKIRRERLAKIMDTLRRQCDN